MTYFQTTTDASDLYRPNSAAGSDKQAGTAVSGNLADLMRNRTIFREAFVAPVVVHENNPAPDTHIRSNTFGPL